MDTVDNWWPRSCGDCANLGNQGARCGDCIASPEYKPNWTPRTGAPRPLDVVGAKIGAIRAAVAPDRYPDDNPKTIHGLAKPPMGLIPGAAMVAMAEAMRLGQKKYGPANWRDKPVTTSTYTSAALRHIFAAIDGEDTDPESGAPHLGHAMACLAIIIDAQACGTLNDDRPTPGKTAEMIRRATRPVASE